MMITQCATGEHGGMGTTSAMSATSSSTAATSARGIDVTELAPAA